MGMCEAHMLKGVNNDIFGVMLHPNEQTLYVKIIALIFPQVIQCLVLLTAWRYIVPSSNNLGFGIDISLGI